jgi:radical SAM protein with 4Fe4S-binding SPASM domain
LGPAADGGFYLLGVGREAWLHRGRAVRELLLTAPLGSSSAADHLLRGADDFGMQVVVLPLWVDVDDAADLPLAVRLQDPSRRAARGRTLGPLRELYLHLTDACAGTCSHCYNGDRGTTSAQRLSWPALGSLASQAWRLGCRRFVLLGGDPFLHPDLLPLVDHLTGELEAQVRLFSGRPLSAATVDSLAASGHDRLTVLLSIDGPARCHDVLRGAGSHAAMLETGRLLARAGLPLVVYTVLAAPVLAHLDRFPQELAAEGLNRLHLTLPYQRGRAVAHPGLLPTAEELVSAFERLSAAAERAGVTVDNVAAWRERSRRPRDFCSAGCSTLAVGPDARIYPCPLTVGDPFFVAGDLGEQSLERVWDLSPLLRLIRCSSCSDRPECAACGLRERCGGECWVAAHYAAREAGRPAGPRAPFPYCELVGLLESIAGFREDARETLLGPAEGAASDLVPQPPAHPPVSSDRLQPFECT